MRCRGPRTTLDGMTTHLRRGTPADRDAIDGLLRGCALPVPGAGPADAVFFVIEEAGGLLGCAGMEWYGDDGLLRSVAVAQAARGMGLGARLTEAVVAEARRRGLRALYALTTTAERYFPRLGFEVIGREEIAPAVQESEEFSSICPSTATALRLQLGS